ncbi:MAG: putative Ig domain-containing protein, partial [Actinomycetota bacterium]
LPSGASFGNPATVIGALECSTTGECALAGSYRDASSTRGFVGASVAQLRLKLPLPNGAVGSNYRQQTAVATGGTGSVSYLLQAGSVPDGLSLNEQTGVLSGMPTSTGTSTFTIVVSDLGDPPQTAVATYSLTIGKGIPPMKVVSLTPSPKSGRVMSLRFTGLVAGATLNITVKGATGPAVATFKLANVGDIQTLNFSLVTRDHKAFQPGIYLVTATMTSTANYAAGVLAPFPFMVH